MDHKSFLDLIQEEHQICKRIQDVSNILRGTEGAVADGLTEEEKLLTDQIKLQRYRQEYSRFSKAAGLRTEDERLHVAKFGRGEAARASAAAKTAPKPSAPVAEKKVAAGAPQKNYRYINPRRWYPDAVPNSHPVRDLLEYTVDGVVYKVDGHNVVLDYSAHEKEIAELLEREIGGERFMVPRVNNPQNVSTPDYRFHGRGYDLKTLEPGAGKSTIFNRIKKAKKQAHNFIIDVTKTNLDDQTIDSQIDKIFWSKDTQFVDEIVVIRGEKIVRIGKRA